MMKNKTLEDYLIKNRLAFDEMVLDEIIKNKKESISRSDEEEANYYWLLEHMFVVKALFIKTFNEIKSKNYESAWNHLEDLDIDIMQLFDNSDEEWLNQFSINFIRKMIPEYQKLFPYFLFISRDGIIKKEVCSICGKEIRLRGGCRHKVGKLYMGEICYAKVVDYQLRCFAVVTNPFDKYTVLKIPNQPFNYTVLESVIAKIDSPYQEFCVKKEIVSDKREDNKQSIEWLESVNEIKYLIDIKGRN